MEEAFGSDRQTSAARFRYSGLVQVIFWEVIRITQLPTSNGEGFTYPARRGKPDIVLV